MFINNREQIKATKILKSDSTANIENEENLESLTCFLLTYDIVEIDVAKKYLNFGSAYAGAYAEVISLLLENGTRYHVIFELDDKKGGKDAAQKYFYDIVKYSFPKKYQEFLDKYPEKVI